LSVSFPSTTYLKMTPSRVAGPHHVFIFNWLVVDSERILTIST